MLAELLEQRWTPAIAGSIGVGLAAFAADIWAIKTKRPTVSALWSLAFDPDSHNDAAPQAGEGGTGSSWRRSGWLAALSFGTVMAFFYHFVGDPLIRRLERARGAYVINGGTGSGPI